VIPLNGTADSAVAAYEKLRSHMLSGSPGGPHFSTLVLLRQGIVAWIECGAACRGAATQSATAATPRPVLAEALQAEIVNVLADIVLKRREEMNA
jgi:hypothetical protein